ncbi:MAG: hypothetical protein MT490_01135 [Sphingomonas sp.]|uniref:hypothetical protein n=1 Tax=Sphingomonas sp. TaxID=28214 RepID=UPI002276FBC0|nr:hypothetical protein [Sphingomonas sp.]MCX8474373.1 hypothetical protein [Sphingomonas sp.]
MRELSFRRGDRRILLPVRVLGAENGSDMTSFAATALLDTGATASGLGPAVIEALALRSHMKKRLMSATEEVFADYYLFRIGFYTSEQMDHIEESVTQWPFVFPEVEGFSWRRPADFDVILGMDILSKCDIEIGRDGTCRLRFG